MHDVLLAEDDPVSRRFLEDALQLLDHRCTAVDDGLAALRLARSQRFDLLLFDVNLPGMAGPDVLGALRACDDARSRDAAALALTADDDPALQARLRAAGFDGVGCKPLGVDALATLLATIHVASTAPGVAPCTWDDASALAATSHDRGIVDALRTLMLRELPRQRTTLAAALDAGDTPGARAELHRLRAACGFCGAAALGQAIDALDLALAAGRPTATARLAVDAAADALSAPTR